LVTFAAFALFSENGEVPAGTFENQPDHLLITSISNASPGSLQGEFAPDIKLAATRLEKLRQVLNGLHALGAI
jgi:hypothetical protein